MRDQAIAINGGSNLMSILYAKSNQEGARDLFEKRTIYKIDATSDTYSNLVDFNFGEKFLYGRVNRFYVPMVLAPAFVGTKTFKRTADPKKALSALSFVVDAFEQMARQFEKCAELRKIDTTDQFLTNLRVYKAYEDHNALYNNHKSIYLNSLKTIFKNQGIKVKNFDEFIKELMNILQRTAYRNAFTKPGFIKSKRCPMTCSGLAIEIADLDAANDEEKINQFVNSLNWDFYLQTCASYGFMVDKAVPWRIVADIGSAPYKSAIFDYAKNYGLNSTTQIIGFSYRNAYVKYYENFKLQLLSLYNNIKLKSFLELHECEGSIISKKIIPASYTMESLSKQYTESDFMRMYFQIRFMEEESPFSDDQKLMIVDDCIKVMLKLGTLEALNIFERILNKTLDYNGSLSYIKKRLDIIRMEQFEEGETT
jgi:hypothetical protein